MHEKKKKYISKNLTRMMASYKTALVFSQSAVTW